MIILLSFVCVDLLADVFLIGNIKKESYKEVSIILNLKWLIFLLYYLKNNSKKLRHIPV